EEAIDRFGAGSEEVGEAIERRLTEADEVVRGTVASVDVGRSLLVLRQPAGDRSFELDAGAELYLAGDEIELADLRPGDEVRVALDGVVVDFVVVRRG